MRYLAFATAVFGASSFLHAADPQLLSLIMPDAQVVAGINVAKAKTSPFGQFVLMQMPTNGDFSNFVSISGFDPRQDLQEVLMATVAGQNNGLVAARGTFNAAKILSLISEDSKQPITTYNGVQLVAFTKDKADSAVAILDQNFAVMGNLSLVKAAIDRRKSPTTISAELAAKVAMYGAADAWTVSLVPLSSLGGAKTAGPFDGVLQGDLLKKVNESSGSVTFDSPVHVNGELLTDTPQDATALGDVVKFLASMVQTSGGTGSPVATLVQSLTVSTVGNVLKLALSIPEDQLEALIQSGAKESGKKKGAVRI